LYGRPKEGEEYSAIVEVYLLGPQKCLLYAVRDFAVGDAIIFYLEYEDKLGYNVLGGNFI